MTDDSHTGGGDAGMDSVTPPSSALWQAVLDFYFKHRRHRHAAAAL